MGFHIGPRVLRATGGSSDHKDGFRIHHFPPKIVENGLMFNLDFGDKRCDSGDGSTTYHDLSGNGKNFTRSGGFAFTGFAGGVREFDGNNDHIFRNDPELVVGLKKFTIQFNFLTENTSTRQGLVSSHMSYGGNYQDAIELEIDASNRIMTGFRRSPGSTFTPVTSGAISTNTWYDVAMVVDGQTVRQYINGSQSGSNSYTVGSVTETPNTNPTLVLGRYASHYLHGFMGYCRMYNRSLSAAEVLRNYNATRIRHINADWTDTFTPTCSGQKGKVEVLVVGAGGNGGQDVGGGGGGAQVTHDPSLTVTSGTSITATVGNHRVHSSGNDQSSGPNHHGANGRSSSFSTLTALGGNGGSGRSGTKSSVGMHGGGASYSYPAVTSPSGGGNAGGAGDQSAGNNDHGSGGGGGAGSAGEAGVSLSKGGNGGDGAVYDISGEPVAYGAGGGGSYYEASGVRGLGGSNTGGDGGGRSTGSGPGANNGRHGTGSGGGGAHSNGTYNYNNGHGGHGTVIVRYPAEEYEVEVLVVAGGGGGGKSGAAGSDPAGGGGGGGGVVFKSAHKVLSGKNYHVNVGNGGAGTSSNSAFSHAPNGVNSVFDDIIAIGGGAGGTGNGKGLTGGSGGGGGGNSGEKASGTPQQGNDGGDPHSDGGGGGGGAGAAGTNAGEGGSGHGGAGKAYTISGSSVTYGGGGGGGARLGNTVGNGGAGGGGAGQIGSSGSNGSASTGGGGGGTSTGSQGGNGGSGIVIVAYKGPQRGEGGTVSTTARSGYTTHTFNNYGDDTYIA